MFCVGSRDYFRSRNAGSRSPPVGSAGSLGGTAVKRIGEGGGSPSSVFEGRAFYETGSDTEDEEPRLNLLSLLEQHWYGGQCAAAPQRVMSAPEPLPAYYTAAAAPQRAMSAPLPLRPSHQQHACDPPTPFTRPPPIKVPLPAKAGARPPPTAPVPVPHSSLSYQGPALARAPGRAHPAGSLLVSPTAAAGGGARGGSAAQGCSPRAALPLTPTAGGMGVSILVSSMSSGNGSCSSLGSCEEGRELAWRWRFSRKWVAVGQQQGLARDGSGGSSSDDCDLLDAIEYAQACGMGAHLQVTNHEMRRCKGMLPKSQSCQFDLSGHGRYNALDALLAAAQDDAFGDPANFQSGSFKSCEHGRLGSGGATGALCHMGGALQKKTEEEGQQRSATTDVLTLASAAKDLLEKQQLIEEALQSRVGQCLYGPEAAACGKLEQVRIPMSGRFRFALLRAVDSSGHQRYLVRTGEGSLADPAGILKAAVAEAAALCKRQGLLPMEVELMGSGVMEWRQDTDRHLHISAPAVAAPPSRAAPGALSGLLGASSKPSGGWGMGARCGLGGGAAALASCLVRQALPWHFQVSHSSSF